MDADDNTKADPSSDLAPQPVQSPISHTSANMQQTPPGNRWAVKLSGFRTRFLVIIFILLLLAAAYFIIRGIFKTKTKVSLNLPPTQQGLVFRPTGPGALTQWNTQNPQTGAHWDKVAEVKADDDATYIEASSAANLLDVYTHSPLDITAKSSIENLTVCARSKYVTSGAHNMVAPALISNTKQVWEDKTIGPVYSNYCSVWTTDPNTNAHWTIDSVNNVQFGVRKSYADAVVRVTQVYMLINYTPPQK